MHNNSLWVKLTKELKILVEQNHQQTTYLNYFERKKEEMYAMIIRDDCPNEPM